jgi:hypothetical protein
MSRKEEYRLELKDKRWKARRKEIIARDGGACVRCGNKKYLQVHHKMYIEGRKAWEYEDEWLETLCRSCHELEHDIDGCRTKLEIEALIEEVVSSLRGIYPEIKERSVAMGFGSLEVVVTYFDGVTGMYVIFFATEKGIVFDSGLVKELAVFKNGGDQNTIMFIGDERKLTEEEVVNLLNF